MKQNQIFVAYVAGVLSAVAVGYYFWKTNALPTE